MARSQCVVYGLRSAVCRVPPKYVPCCCKSTILSYMSSGGELKTGSLKGHRQASIVSVKPIHVASPGIHENKKRWRPRQAPVKGSNWLSLVEEEKKIHFECCCTPSSVANNLMMAGKKCMQFALIDSPMLDANLLRISDRWLIWSEPLNCRLEEMWAQFHNVP